MDSSLWTLVFECSPWSSFYILQSLQLSIFVLFFVTNKSINWIVNYNHPNGRDNWLDRKFSASVNMHPFCLKHLVEQLHNCNSTFKPDSCLLLEFSFTDIICSPICHSSYIFSIILLFSFTPYLFLSLDFLWKKDYPLHTPSSSTTLTWAIQRTKIIGRHFSLDVL